jgi:hypothetical protein
MIETVGIILGFLGIIFAFETPRSKFLAIFRRFSNTATEPSPIVPSRPPAPSSPIYGATQSGRQPFFIREPYKAITDAQQEAQQSTKLIFLVIYDQDHPSQSKLYYSLGCFLDYFTTKRLVDDHFVAALVPLSAAGARELVPQDDPLENALWVVLNANGEIVRRESVYANADEGLKRVRAVVGGLANAKSSFKPLGNGPTNVD